MKILMQTISRFPFINSTSLQQTNNYLNIRRDQGFVRKENFGIFIFDGTESFFIIWLKVISSKS